MYSSVASKGTAAPPSRVPRKALAPLRRSGITHLSSPNYAQPAASASASPLLFTSTASVAHPAAGTRRSSALSTGHCSSHTLEGSTLQAQMAASARCASRSPSPQALDPYPASIRSPTLHRRPRRTLTAFGNGSTGEDVSSSPSWGHHVAAVCHRLQHTVHEAEQILMPVTASAATASSSVPLNCNSSDRFTCTLVQAMDALQRYRTGCMAAMLELDYLQEHHFSVSSGAPLVGETEEPTTLCSPIRSARRSAANEVDKAGTLTSSPIDAAQLHHRYRVMRARLAETLAGQSAYMQEITLQQQLREREGVMGEYMWSTRLLVEQESAERAHLASLWAYFIASAPERWTASKARAGTGLKSSAAVRVPQIPATAVPPPPEEAKDASYAVAAPLPQPSTYGGDEAARLVEQNKALLRDLYHSKERTCVLLHEQQKGLQEAQECALAQLIARHDAEKAALETRVYAAQAAAAQSQHRLTEVKEELAAVQSSRRETQRCTGLTYDGMHQQLKDTTKKMWQLQLVNDHLDAKVRVLERELEEMRLSRSPVRRRQGGNETLFSAVEQASRSASRSTTGAVHPSNGCSSSHGTGRSSGVNNAHYERPFALSRRASTDSAAGHGCRDVNSHLVGPGVWTAYEERSSLLTRATPVMQHENSSLRPPITHVTYPHGSSLAAVSATSITTGTDMNVSHMSEGGTAHAPRLCTHQRNFPSATRAAGDGDNDSTSSGRHRRFERTVSPPRQLSLDRTPIPQPSVAYPPYAEEAETDNEFDSIAYDDPSRGEQNAVKRYPTASAQTNVAESLRSAIPRPPGGPATISTHSQPSSDAKCDGWYPPPLAVPHGLDSLKSGEGTANKTHVVVAEGEEGELQPSLASLCSSPTVSNSRARLEALRRDILRHAEQLEQEVQAVTSRYEAARRQRRRERETLRVNVSVHSASNSPSTSEPRDDEGRQTVVVNVVDADSEALNRALEVLHIEQQEDDDELEHYYADVNQKRLKLERCLCSIEDKLAALL
ncbi:hypothetical protein NXY56_003337 [Leishmania guyanensis]